MTYQPPPSYYPPQQWPPPQPPKKKTPRFVIALIAVCALALAVLALHESGGKSDTTPRSTTSRATEGTADATATPEPSAAAQPRDTLRFEDGLTATITNITTGISTNSAEQDGPITVIQIELRNTGSETLDAANWWAPYVNYGPQGLASQDLAVAGKVNGIEPDIQKGRGLIPPGGVVTVSSAYGIALDDMSPATITPRWPGRLLWSGDFAAEFSH